MGPTFQNCASLSLCMSFCLPACLPGCLPGWLSVCLSHSLSLRLSLRSSEFCIWGFNLFQRDPNSESKQFLLMFDVYLKSK